MEEPPFQFGLKAVFGVMTGAAMLLAGLISSHPGVQFMAVIAMLWLFWIVVVVACGYAFCLAAYHSVRLVGWLRNKCLSGLCNQPPDTRLSLLPRPKG